MKNARHPPPKQRRETLQSWLTYRHQEPYYQYLELLTKIVQSIFKQETTTNPNQVLTLGIENRLEEKTKPLFKTLVHSITLLNHTYRVFTTQGYASTEEDVLSAAALLQLKINPESILFVRTKLIYWDLQQVYGSEEFTVRAASLALVIPKKTLNRHLIALQHTGYVKHIRTGIRNTYYYQLS